MGAVRGFPGDVYQLTVCVPTRGKIAAVNPDLANFKLPAQSSMILKIGAHPDREFGSVRNRHVESRRRES